jgi:glycosyltransferase involved in cell wall biosynthesis
MIIAISANSSWNIYNFRRNILLNLEKKYNCTFLFLCPEDSYLNKIGLKKIIFKKIILKSRSIFFVYDIALMFQYLYYFLNYKPSLYLAYTIKPNIYGSFISNILSIKTLNNFTGLGTLFYTNKFVSIIFKKILKLSTRKSNFIFFHNQENINYFIDNKISSINKFILLPGSGVDLKFYNRSYFNTKIKKNSFIFFGRLMKEKGILEFLEVAKKIKKKNLNAKFSVLGKIQENEKDVIISLKKSIDENIIKYYGFTHYTTEIISSYECVVLPSYHEGMSKALLESAALFKPIIASNIHGIKEIIINNVSGILFEKKNINDLKNKINSFVNLSDKKKLLMGIKARKIIEKNFDEAIVIEKYNEILNKLKF